MKQLIYNAVIVDADKFFNGYIVIDDSKIQLVGEGEPSADLLADSSLLLIDCNGDMIMPGAIDTHVHFRDPGLTDKGDMKSESRAAVAGGVTSYIDMPNTRPATVSIETWQKKMDHAATTSVANYAFFIGATNDNIGQILEADYTRVPGIKLFLGSSTGNMLVDNDDTLVQLFANAKSIIAVHAEDEATIKTNRATIESRYKAGEVPLQLHSVLRDRTACFKASKHAVELARKHGARLHLLHISTFEELSLLEPGSVDTKMITAELFTETDFSTKGARIKCNPAIKADSDRLALIRGISESLIDTIATDHAPHLPADKKGDLFKAASGMPGIQFSLPTMLSLELQPSLVSKLMSGNPATLFGIKNRGYIREGYAADIVRVAVLDEPHTVTDGEVISKCGWTPYDGTRLNHRVVTTWVNGFIAFDNNTVATQLHAQPLRFESR